MKLRHSNIVTLIGIVFEPGNYGLVLEYVPYGDLLKFLCKFRPVCLHWSSFLVHVVSAVVSVVCVLRNGSLLLCLHILFPMTGINIKPNTLCKLKLRPIMRNPKLTSKIVWVSEVITNKQRLKYFEVFSAITWNLNLIWSSYEGILLDIPVLSSCAYSVIKLSPSQHCHLEILASSTMFEHSHSETMSFKRKWQSIRKLQLLQLKVSILATTQVSSRVKNLLQLCISQSHPEVGCHLQHFLELAVVFTFGCCLW